MKLIGIFAIISVASAGMQQNPIFQQAKELLNSVGFKDKQLNQFKSTVEKQAANAVNSAIKIAEKHGVKVDKRKLNKLNMKLVPSLEKDVKAYSKNVAKSFKMGQNEAALMMKKKPFVDGKNMIQETTFEEGFKTLEENYSEAVKNIQNPNIKRVLNNNKRHFGKLASAAKTQMKKSGLKGSIFEAARNNGEKIAEGQGSKYLGPQQLNAALSKVTEKLGN